MLLEANVDDMTGEVAGDDRRAMNRPAADGARALDAWATPITMKKGRPALTMHVLCCGGAGDAPGAGDARALTRALEHGRRSACGARARAPRAAPLAGVARARRGRRQARRARRRVVTVHPEYEDCAARGPPRACPCGA